MVLTLHEAYKVWSSAPHVAPLFPPGVRAEQSGGRPEQCQEWSNKKINKLTRSNRGISLCLEIGGRGGSHRVPASSTSPHASQPSFQVSLIFKAPGFCCIKRSLRNVANTSSISKPGFQSFSLLWTPTSYFGYQTLNIDSFFLFFAFLCNNPNPPQGKKVPLAQIGGNLQELLKADKKSRNDLPDGEKDNKRMINRWRGRICRWWMDGRINSLVFRQEIGKKINSTS